MLRRLMQTDGGVAALVLRLALGVMIFPHGAQKVLGWFGGRGPEGTLGYMHGKLGIPVALAVLAMAAELLGGIGLVVGLLGRVAAFGVGCVMVVAMLLVTAHNGFFMNWTGAKPSEGIEFHILALAMAIAVMILGSGAASLDAAIASRGV